MKKCRFIVGMLTTILLVSFIFAGCAKPAPAPAPTPAPAPAPPVVIRWTGVSSMPGSTNEYNLIVMDMIKEIKDKSGGRLEITWHPEGELPYAGKDMLRVVRDNSAQIGDIATGRVAGDLPMIDVGSLPFLAGTEEEFFKLIKAAKPYWREELEKLNQRAIVYNCYPPQQIFTIPEVRSIEQLKGLKIRAWSVPLAKMLELMGAVPVTIDTKEVATALQRGTVEGSITAWYALVTTKWTPLVNYALEANISLGNRVITVNKAAFDSLPGDVQDVLIKVGAKYEEKIFPERLLGMDGEMRAEAIKAGVIATKVPEATRAKLAAQTRAMWDEWAVKAGGKTPELLAAAIKALGK